MTVVHTYFYRDIWISYRFVIKLLSPNPPPPKANFFAPDINYSNNSIHSIFIRGLG